ncbi:MAG: hypothetical protein IE909_19685, partial [Campylobacterales bacterium]|nr:hypothetical protein [Campylobacterales bacterium]
MAVIDVKSPSITSYYVKNPVKMKKVGSAGSSGGSTLYLAQDLAEIHNYEAFFNSFDPSNTYSLSKESLNDYLLSVKFEYILNIAPPENREYSGDVSLDYWDQKYQELQGLSATQLAANLNVERHMASSPDRLYIRTVGYGFDFLRKIAIPDISSMVIEKIDNGDGTFTYEFKPTLKEDFVVSRSTEDNDDTATIPDDGRGVNLILYGAPGTGKSHELDDRYANVNHMRVTFHPEYTYHDFVGSFRPEPLYKLETNPSNTYKFFTVENEEFTKGEPYINYKFVPGPFT